MGFHLLNKSTKNQRGCEGHFPEERPQSWLFSQICQVQGHGSPLVPPSSNTNFGGLMDLYLYFLGLLKKFCYRNVLMLIYAIEKGRKFLEIDENDK